MAEAAGLVEATRWADRLRRRALELLWLATTLSALGRGWRHFTQDGPYWSFFWSEELLSPALSRLGVEWSSYVESPSVEAAISALSMSIGLTYLGVGLALARVSVRLIHSGEVPHPTAALRASLWALLGLQLAYVGSHWLGHSLYLPIWLEQSTLIALPWLCLSTGLRSEEDSSPDSPDDLYLTRAPITVARVALSCTFIGHGVFALGLYPVPEDFILMVMRTCGATQQGALTLLWWAGALDVLAALAVWVPRRHLRVRWAALSYMLVWGGLTALARVIGHWGLGTATETIWYWLPELMLRLPHALIPWWLLTLEGGVRPYLRWRSLTNPTTAKDPPHEHPSA